MKTRLSKLFFFFMIALLLHSYNVQGQRMCHSASRGGGRMGGCSGGVQHHQAGGGAIHPGVGTQNRWFNRGSMKPSNRSANTSPSNNNPRGNDNGYDMNNRNNNSNNKSNNINNSHNVNNTVVPRKNIASYRGSPMPMMAEGVIVIILSSIDGKGDMT